jgi:hypothetical protein
VSEPYVHGYHRARTNACRIRPELWSTYCTRHLHTRLEASSSKLRGVGAQTVTLAQRSPARDFTSVDVSADSVAEAKRKTDAAGLTNVQFQQADIFALPFAPNPDHVFVCFVLSTYRGPLRRWRFLPLLRPGGTMTVVEGDHGSTFFHPDSSAARMAIQCQVELQRLAGGNALIGRQSISTYGRGGARSGSRVSTHGGWIRADLTSSMASRGRRSPR